MNSNRADEASIRPLRARPRYRATRLGLGLVLAAVVVFTVLFTADLEVDEPNVDGFPAASCGSAYDVAFIKGDGFMGGEVPINQDAIDRKCVDKAQLYVGASVLAGGVLLAAGVLLLQPDGASGAEAESTGQDQVIAASCQVAGTSTSSERFHRVR